MSLLQQLTEDMKSALKSGQKERLSTIRLLRGQLKDAEIAKREPLDQQEEIAVLTRAAKKRRESIQAYQDAGRQDLADREQRELEIVQNYLPQPLSQEEIEKIVDEAITAAGALSVKDLGKVMPLIMARVKGRADGKRINELVRSKLT